MKGAFVTALTQSLARLADAIDNLETSMEGFEQTLAGQQRDMFAAPPPKPVARKAKGGQAAMSAQRLDHAIEKAEQLLAQR